MDTFSSICQIIALRWYLHLRWSCLTLWNHFENLTSSAATFPQRLRLCRIHIDRGSTKASPRAVWLLWIIMRLSLMERNVTHLPHVSYIVTFVCTLHKFVIHCHHCHNCHIDVTLCHTVSHIDVCYTILSNNNYCTIPSTTLIGICSSVVHSMTLVTDIDEDLSLEIAPQTIYHLIDKYV